MKSEYMHTAIGVIGVVVNASHKVLLVLSKDRGREVPMGFLEPNESPLVALHREILEESGYTVNVRRLTGVYYCIKNEVVGQTRRMILTRIRVRSLIRTGTLWNLLSHHILPSRPTTKNEMPILSLCFLCEVGELVSAAIKESLAVQWVDKEKLKDFITYQPHLLRITDALQGEHIFFRDYQIQPFLISSSWVLQE